MKIYQIGSTEGFRDISVDDRSPKAGDVGEPYPGRSTALDFTGKPLGSQWRPPALYSMYPRKPFPDVGIIGVGGVVVNSCCLDVLDSFLEMAGELYIVGFEGKAITICNITECVDCIDASKSLCEELCDGTKMWRKLHFDSSLLPESTLFKIPQWPNRIYCWERHKDAEGEFKACYEKHKLKGVHFRLVQSGEE